MPTIPNPTCQDCRQAPAASLHAHRCASCQAKHQQMTDRFRGRRDSNKFEKGNPWRHCSEKIRRDNPICQRIHFGVRCQNPSVLVHHLQSPEDAPSLRMCPSNLVALCASCHDPSYAGDRGGIDYAPTISNICGVTTTYAHGRVTTSPDGPAAPGTIADALRWMSGK